jgi:predicted amidohydrolase
MSRVVKLATVQVIRPEWDRGSVEENVQQACHWLEEAAALRADIVCLPENVVGMCVPAELAPQPVPGPATDRFCELASRHGMYVIAPLVERSEGRLYGAAVLIDRRGGIAGKYRKVHPTTVAMQRGHSAGDSYPVFQTDFGRIGIMICYDNFFPETARILALNGAEVLFFPTAGDGRGPMAFEVTVRARAIDNCVPVVASVYQNQGRSCIVSAEGYLLADSCEIPGVVAAEVDLDRRITRHEVSGGRGDLREILLEARRPETYHRIVER